MPDKQGSTVEKYLDCPGGCLDGAPIVHGQAVCCICEGEGKVINPAYVDELGGVAKEMAEAVANKWRRPNTNYCNYCVAYARLVSYDNWECNHEPSCPVPRAQEYLKGK